MAKTIKGSVRLGSGHSLIIGHGPKLSSLTPSDKELKTRIESFGLFNLATPDTVSYYQNVSAEDLNPKPEDYFRPVFRGLSETIVRKNYDPIDFGHNKGVLKNSMSLMLGQTVYANHEAFVGNEKGVVSKSFWDHGYTTDDGIVIPAGMNLEFLIDGKIHTKLVRDLQSDPPSVHSNSVTVHFGWQQSHPKMSLEEFRSKVGTLDEKGILVRRIVSEISGYTETSLVSHGADPYAQMIKDGKIVNPKFAHARDSFSEEIKQSSFFAFDWKDSLSEIAIPKYDNIIEEEDLNDNNNPIMNFKLKNLILLVATLTGVSLTAEQTALSEDEFNEKFDFDAFDASLKTAELGNEAIQTLRDQITSLTDEKTTLETEKQTLADEKVVLEKFKTDNSGKLELIAEAEKYKTGVIAEVQKFHGLIAGKPDEAMNATFEKADLATLKAFRDTFSKQLEDKFPSTCKACGSKDISKNSASAGPDDDGKKTGVKTLIEIRDEALHPVQKASSLHG